MATLPIDKATTFRYGVSINDIVGIFAGDHDPSVFGFNALIINSFK